MFSIFSKTFPQVREQACVEGHAEGAAISGPRPRAYVLQLWPGWHGFCVPTSRDGPHPLLEQGDRRPGAWRHGRFRTYGTLWTAGLRNAFLVTII